MLLPVHHLNVRAQSNEYKQMNHLLINCHWIESTWLDLHRNYIDRFEFRNILFKLACGIEKMHRNIAQILIN